MIRRALYQGFGLLAEGKIRKLREDSLQPRAAQERKLESILSANVNSQFGREHGFATIRNAADFAANVPIRDYEGFRPYIDKATTGESQVLTSEDPFMYATTSGTTGKPKFVPITRGYMEEFRLASVVSGYGLLRSFPEIAGGNTLSVVSPAVEGLTPGGTPYGAISGQLFQHEPFLIKKFISPIPYEVFLIKDYESRYYTLLRLAIEMPLSLFYTLNPSTIALLCRRLSTYAPQLISDVRSGTINPPAPLLGETFAAIKKFLKPNPSRAAELSSILEDGQFIPARIWPSLALVSCWTKAAASFYLADFPQFFGNVPVCDITYGASEGRGTVFMGPGQQMLALQSHFFEFVPEGEMESQNPTVLLADQLEIGQNYYLLFTTSGGLYRYNINDVVKVTGMYNNTPLIEFQYKGGNISSFTGEKVTEFQVTAAMSAAQHMLGARLRFFTVVPRYDSEPYYEIWVEPEDGANVALESLAKRFDEQLSEANIEYSAKRESHRLGDVRINALERGAYEGFRKHLVSSGVADAQIKVSHLNPKQEVRDYFDRFLVRKTVVGAPP